jgi:hypothetical protein
MLKLFWHLLKGLHNIPQCQAFLLSPPAALSVTILAQQHYDKDRLNNILHTADHVFLGNTKYQPNAKH